MDFHFSQFEILTASGSIFLCLLLICVFSEASGIEDDLATRVTAEVRKQKIVLAGAAADYQAKKQAGAIAAQMWGVTDVENDIAIIGEAGTCQQEIDGLLQGQRVLFRAGRRNHEQGSPACQAPDSSPQRARRARRGTTPAGPGAARRIPADRCPPRR